MATLILLVLYPAIQVNADEIRPALLDIKEQNTGLFAVTWKVPTRGGRSLAITPKLPDNLELIGSPIVQNVPGAQIEQATYRSNGEALTGQRIFINGLSALQTDVLLLIQLQGGNQHSAILRPASPEFMIPLQASKLKIAGDYWYMGTVHILQGFDHLLFVLALLLIVSGVKSLVKAVTAFTIAHSITLAAASLGLMGVSGPPVEATIALSIVFLANELIKVNYGQASLTAQYPWIVAFMFGLLHGFGFAGALSEIGLPQNELPLALLMFNVGVELGQLMFIAAVMVLLVALRKVRIEWPTWAHQLPAYGIGGVAAFWFVERLSGF